MSAQADRLDGPPPENASQAEAYWCELDYFLAHTAYGDHPECRCREGLGHNDEELADV